MSESKTIDLMEALRNSLRADQPEAPANDFRRPLGAPPVEGVAFPRSKDDLGRAYMLGYKIDVLPMMALWVADVLSEIDEDDEERARSIAYEAARKEIKRSLFRAEFELVSQVARDFVIARRALRRQAADARR
jgi:hypothetical protein